MIIPYALWLGVPTLRNLGTPLPTVCREPAAVEPMKIVIDEDKWRLPCNRAPPRKHSEEKQREIRKQVDALLELGAIKESQATEWSQVHLDPKPTPEGQRQKWRFTLDLYACDIYV